MLLKASEEVSDENPETPPNLLNTTRLQGRPDPDQRVVAPIALIRAEHSKSSALASDDSPELRGFSSLPWCTCCAQCHTAARGVANEYPQVEHQGVEATPRLEAGRVTPQAQTEDETTHTVKVWKWVIR